MSSEGDSDAPLLSQQKDTPARQLRLHGACFIRTIIISFREKPSWPEYLFKDSSFETTSLASRP